MISKKSTPFDGKEVFKDSLGEIAKQELISEEFITQLNDCLNDFLNQTSKSKRKQKTLTFNIKININFNKNKKAEKFEPTASLLYEF